MTFAELHAQLDDLGLSKVDRDTYLNEAHRALCVGAEWTRDSISIGPTVEAQEAYALPATVAQPLRVLVDGVVYDPSDETTVRRIQSGELRIGSHGLWWIKPDDEADNIAIYPTPSDETEGWSIVVTAIVYPDTLSSPSHTPDSPPDFDRALVDYCRAMATGDPQARTFWEDRFDRSVEKLRRRRYSRAGRGPVQMKIVGQTH